MSWVARLGAVLGLGLSAGCAGTADGGGDVGPPDVAGADVEVDTRGDTFTPALDTCAPACARATCGQGDGCGGTCPPCPSPISCASCALRLEVEETTEQDGEVRRATLALVFDPPEEAPGPTTVEVRLGVLGPAELLDVSLGAAMRDAGKTIVPDPLTDEPYRVEPDGTVRVVAVSAQEVRPVGAGVLWRYDVRLGASFVALAAPVAFWIRRDAEAIFAPPPADAVIADPATSDPVAFWPRE